MDSTQVKAAAASAKAELDSLIKHIDALDGTAGDGIHPVKLGELQYAKASEAVHLHPVVAAALVTGVGFLSGIIVAAAFLKRMIC